MSLSLPVVLVVEDNAEMNQFIAESLRSDFNVITAADGQEGLEKTRTQWPDLIVADVMMPRLSGDQLVQEVRARPELAGIPIILLTARADDDLRVKLLREGAQDYLVKPFSPEELLARVRNLIRLKQATSELELRVAERSAVAEQRAQALARSNAALESFAYVASHDLQEPLRMISSYVQLLARRYQGRLDTDADEFIQFAVDGANRMKALIDGLLEYARVGKEVESFLPTSSQEALNQALVNLRFTIQESNAVITSENLPTVESHMFPLSELFQNLIGNAIKFRSAEPPRVHIAVKRMETEWMFSVRDNGIGIDPTHSERIFGIFSRLHPRDKYAGTGIGLAICKKIVEQHNGRIWVESQVNQGATFIFTIPVGKDRLWLKAS